MDISLFLAQVFGLYFILVGVIMLIRPTGTQELLLALSNHNTVLVNGFIALMIGVLLVLLHNIWDGSWRVIITVLVWATLCKGMIRMLVPDLVASWTDMLVRYPRVVKHLLWVVIITGLYLVYQGFDVSL